LQAPLRVPAVHPALEESSGSTLENRLRFPDSAYMRQTPAPRSSLDVRDQWGIQFPLLPEELDELVQPKSSSLAQVISSWRLSIAAAWPAPDDALDQWGIEFQIPDGELATLVRHRRRGCLQAGSSVLCGRLRGISQAGAWAAILAVVVAGSALAVNPPASASAGAAPPDGAPTGGQPVVIGAADSAQIGSLPSITEQPSMISNPTPGPTPGPISTPTPGPTPDATSIPTPGPTPDATSTPTPGPTPSATSNPTPGPTPSATSNPTPGPTPSATSTPTPGPTPGATPSAESIAIKPESSIPASAVLEARPRQVGLITVPTIQDARSYLVARLGAKVDKHWGMAQSQCASLIFEYEARWNPLATNKTSGAYGLPQAKPASKLANWAEAKARAAEEAGDPVAAWLYRAWRDNPVVQAEWGVDYMIKRYGSPCAALAFRSGYWKDGVLIPGVGWY
jgi:hypothetical protein